MPRVDFAALDASAPLGAFAARMLAPYLAGDPLDAGLEAIAHAALVPDPPRVALDRRTEVLELFHGPTAAFKDYGARFLAEALARTAPPARAARVVLVATSGDTGGAVAAAFAGRTGFRVVVLYPANGVSARQAHQLGAFGPDVTALAVAGRFDDCQRLVKRAFADAALREAVPLVSANSISLGRLLPQSTYFAQAALALHRAHGGAASFAIPSGNLGHATACVLARAMGAPIARVALATNANRTVADWLADGELRPRASIPTLANAMDVGDPSNAERLAWLYPGADDRARALECEVVDDAAIARRIVASAAAGYVPCPHTACALELVARRRAAGDEGVWCIAATAHPAKFDDIVEPLIGRQVPPPRALAELLARPSRSAPLAPDDDALRAVLRTGTRAADPD
jgi:threonine synthase